jgi:hypothetical protein
MFKRSPKAYWRKFIRKQATLWHNKTATYIGGDLPWQISSYTLTLHTPKIEQ